MNSTELLASLRLDLEHEGLGYRAHSLADLRAAGVSEAVILLAVQAALKGRVDARAEALRTQVATPGAGQAMEYQEAQAQAASALADPSAASAAAYPMLAASIGLDVDPETGDLATDVLGVARSVQAARAAWLAIGATIRRIRLEGKAAIAAAPTPEASADAFAATTWPPLG